MRPLKLHSKTTLLASLITVGMLAAALVVTSASIANLEREDDIVLGNIQVKDLAQQIGNMPVPRDQDALDRAVTLIKDSRPNIVSVRIWERNGDKLTERIAAPANHPPDSMPADVLKELLDNPASHVVSRNPVSNDPTLRRVYAGTFFAGGINGAVEIVERFDSIWSVVFRYLKGAVWMALTAVALITLGTYLLFRRLVYQPLDRLINAMSRAKTGDLEAQVPASAPDEIGLLTDEFNSMIRQVREMTREREAQQVTLREKVRDATNELERRNQQLQETNLELWRTTRRMNELGRLAAAGQTAAQFAHEVGTPLNLISGHVQLLGLDLARNPGDGEARIRIIGEQIERIERIVRTMLDRTRFETELTPVDLNQILQRLLDATSPALDKRRVRIVEKFDPNLPLISGSSDRLQQLFLNLINNALDAMPDGGELTVSTTAEQSPGGKTSKVIVDFADDGSGIVPETLAHIFDPLYTTKAPGQGTGLGLVIVSQVVRDHGGEVEVQSKPGEGTRFRLTFPVARTNGSGPTEIAAADRKGEMGSAE